MAFFTNITDLEDATTALRQIYGRAAESDQITKTLEAMRESGLSRKAYREFLEEARRIGLVGDPLTYEEITQPIPADRAFYGIGP